MKRLITLGLVFALLLSCAAMAEAKLAWYGVYSSPYIEEVKGYAEQFAADTSTEVRILIGSQNDQMTQDNNLRALVGDGYYYIASYPGTDGAAGLYDDLASFGVKIAGYGASTANEAEELCVATDVYAAAYAACEYIIEQMDGKGGILSCLSTVNDTNTLKRKQAVEDCVAAHEGIELIQHIVDIKSIDQGVEKISAALTANEGKVQGIVCTHTAAGSAAAQVLDDYYSRNPDAEKICLITADTPDDVMKGIENGVVSATVAQNTFAHGYVPLMALKLMSEGWEVKPDAYFIDSGYVILTKDNADSLAELRVEVTNRIVEELTTKYMTKN